MIKRLLVIWLLLVNVPVFLMGQPYEHAAGVRAGYSSGFTYKGFLRYRMSALRLDGLYNPHGLHICLQYLYHAEPFRNSRWLVFAGGGAFSGRWEGSFSAGLSVTGGIEYVMRDLPLNFGLDWKPMLNIYRDYGIDLLDFGISIRYRFSL
jgi:hypothetical protein